MRSLGILSLQGEVVQETVIYRKGKTVEPDGWDEDRWDVCSHGIHFFLTRIEAENYQL